MKTLQTKPRLFKIPIVAAWIFPRRLWYGASQNVYLSFDDGPHPEITPWLLDELKRNNIKATFFWQGNQIEKHPELLQRAKNEGHSVGHHGYEHKSGKSLNFDAFKINFDQSNQLVDSKLYRPPYGDLKSSQARYAAKNGKIVMWNWMSYDFDSTVSIEQIIQKAKTQIKGGDILVFHENEKTNHRIKEIIPAIIKVIRDKELNFARIEKKR
ncbi:polysaccharide deacetylase family protein [Brumimicrobium salinarum]|uniref:polysaccharide deacetylase family protein n=1 Tax=Brumimicrobium salinarum TaxID=2058658 RepID=UPI0013FDFBB8|nr:polysaccharide deacetylase family protein [Brumimicrobium salinarum]